MPFRQFSGKKLLILQIKTCCSPEHIPALSSKQGKGRLTRSPVFSTLSPPNIASSTTAWQKTAIGATGRSWRGARCWGHELLLQSSKYQVARMSCTFLKHLIQITVRDETEAGNPYVPIGFQYKKVILRSEGLNKEISSETWVHKAGCLHPGTKPLKLKLRETVVFIDPPTS